MKILVTGAAGFLGKELVNQLRSRNHNVVETDRRSPTQLSGDLADAEFARSLPDVDCVIHCAAVQYVSKPPVLGRKKYFYQNNILATRNLTSRYSGENTHFVHVSTSMVYEQTGADLYTTSSPKKGQGVYSESKIVAEELVGRMPNPKAIVIPCIIAGEGREGLFVSFVKSMTKFGFVAFPGKGDHPIHMVHVKDLTRLLIEVAEKKGTGFFNAGGSEPLSINAWVSEIEDELHLKTVRRVLLPLSPIRLLSEWLGYIPLAKEQLLMLHYKHILDLDESYKIGWKPEWSNAKIVRETARTLADK